MVRQGWGHARSNKETSGNIVIDSAAAVLQQFCEDSNRKAENRGIMNLIKALLDASGML